MLFAQQLDGSETQAEPWNMARITMAIGQENCLLNRYLEAHIVLLVLLTFFQLSEKIIPTFKKEHGPGYQALIMVDNSQGHFAYAEDALVASRMNVKPGGAQACMCSGWYIQDGRKITQPMIFPAMCQQHASEPKGLCQVLEECGINTKGIRGKCKKCEPGKTTCCC
jgi:hypothetical protein